MPTLPLPVPLVATAAVQLFCMVQPASKRWAVSVTAQDYGPIKVTTGYMNTATGNLVSDANISKLWKPKEAAKTQRFPEVREEQGGAGQRWGPRGGGQAGAV